LINTTTYSTLWNYLQANKRNCKLYYWIVMEPIDGGTDSYFTDCPENDIAGYNLADLQISAFNFRADLYNGNYNVGPVHITMENWAKPQGDGSTERFSDGFSTDDWETSICKIYMGTVISGTSYRAQIYGGSMANFRHTYTRIEFDVVDRAIFELPNIPNNYFDAGNYPYVDKDFIGKPIPLVYGRWRYEYTGSGTYRPLAFIPGYIIENNLDTTTPQIKLEYTDQALDAIDKVFMLDEVTGELGEIQDTISNSAGDATSTITFFTENVLDFLTTNIYLYPDPILGYINITNIGNVNSGVYTSYGTMNPDTAPLDYATYLARLGDMDSFSEKEMTPIFHDTSGENTVGIESARIEISAYASASSEGDVITVSIENSNFSDTQEHAIATTPQTSFNYTFDNLYLSYNYLFDGSTTIFELQEATNDSGTSPGSKTAIQPDAGRYWTMEMLAKEIEKQIEDNGGFTNTYKVSYLKNLNKIRVEGTDPDGASKPYFKIFNAGQADDVGFTGDTDWVNTYLTSDDYTILDIPDGDFGLAQIVVKYESADNNLYLIGARIRIVRKHRSYNIRKTSEGRRPFNHRSPNARTSTSPYGERGTRTIIRGGDQGSLRPLFYGLLETDYQRANSIRDKVQEAKFFATVDGKPTGATYFAKGPEIIEDILENVIGVSVDSTGFTTANSNVSHEQVVYLDAETKAENVLFDLARFAKGFLHINHAGNYTMTTLKSSYSSADFTIYKRDIKEPLNDNFVITRNEISNISKDLTFYYLFDLIRDDYNKSVSKTVTTDLNIEANSIQCGCITDDTDADTIAEYFCGDGATYGQFGELKKVVEMTTVNPEFHFAELGDIMKFDSTDFSIKAFGSTISDIYFMLVEKQFDKHQIKMKLLEVG